MEVKEVHKSILTQLQKGYWYHIERTRKSIQVHQIGISFLSAVNPRHCLSEIIFLRDTMLAALLGTYHAKGLPLHEFTKPELVSNISDMNLFGPSVTSKNFQCIFSFC
jgi:hypothetical protein